MGMTFADLVVRAVAELPDRTSPEDQPEMMLVTPDELRAIINREIGYTFGRYVEHMKPFMEDEYCQICESAIAAIGVAVYPSTPSEDTSR